MTKKKDKTREKKRQRQQARKAAQKKRIQQSRRSAPSSSKHRPVSGLMASGFGTEQFAMLLIDSEKLADEPEFEDILINPLQCMQAWAHAVDSAGINFDHLDRLSEDEQEDTIIDIQDAVVRRVLTADLRQQILQQVDALQQRYKNKGKNEAFLQASAIHTFLTSDKKGEAWAMVGLVRALVMNSMQLGLELVDITEGDPEQLLADPEKQQKLETLYEINPKLQRFLSKEMDDLWNENMSAIFGGEWELNLFTPDEINGSAEIFGRYFPPGENPEERAEDFQDRSIKLLSEIESYMRSFLTPERLEQMRIHLDDLPGDISDGQQIFARMLYEDLKSADELDDLMPFLLKIFLGEVRAVMKQEEADAGESE